jgi:hypothetical protein
LIPTKDWAQEQLSSTDLQYPVREDTAATAPYFELEEFKEL